MSALRVLHCLEAHSFKEWETNHDDDAITPDIPYQLSRRPRWTNRQD